MSGGPLQGIRIVEMGAIGPAPFCGMHFADLGADVIIIERPEPDGALTSPGPVLRRGKRSVALNLKDPMDVKKALAIIATADGLIEGMRPGVMERLGLGPDVCLAKNPRLVFGRITGWGQTGPQAHTAGHDLNYLGVSGAAWFAGAAGNAPVPPPTLVGDIGGGALYLMIGLLSGILRARATGEGDVVDAAIVDGSAHMQNLLFDVVLKQTSADKRGQSILDGAHFYRPYQCADGGFISVGCLEPKFYAEFLRVLGLGEDELLLQQSNSALWKENSARLEKIFIARPRDEWCALFAGTDACVWPMLNPIEAAANVHMQARGAYFERDGLLQAAPAPSFLRSGNREAGVAPQVGEHTEEILAAIVL